MDCCIHSSWGTDPHSESVCKMKGDSSSNTWNLFLSPSAPRILTKAITWLQIASLWLWSRLPRAEDSPVLGNCSLENQLVQKATAWSSSEVGLERCDFRWKINYLLFLPLQLWGVWECSFPYKSLLKCQNEIALCGTPLIYFLFSSGYISNTYSHWLILPFK